MNAWSPSAAAAAIALSTIGFAGPARGETGRPVQLGDIAPAIELDDVAGGLVSLSRFRGQTVVVQFFATWCEPCHHAWEDLSALRAEASLVPGQGHGQVPPPHVVLVDLGEPREVVARWVDAARLTSSTTMALDLNGSAAARWGANRLPTVFVLDGSGIIRHINRGWGPGYRDRLRRWLSRDERALPTTREPSVRGSR